MGKALPRKSRKPSVPRRKGSGENEGLQRLGSTVQGQSAFEPQKLTRLTLNEQVHAQLKRAIMSGTLLPGRVLTIRELAGLFGVSMMPVREALGRLIAEHALILKPNRSVAIPLLTSERFAQITKVRLLIEGAATKDGAAVISEQEIAELSKLNAEMEKIGRQNREAYFELNRKFHFLIYSASGQDYLLDLIESLWLQIGPILSSVLQDIDTKPGEREKHHHELIVALHKRDAAGAQRAIVADIEDAAEQIVSVIRAQEEQSPSNLILQEG
jgi:DNA-binding GntR family transcriptional regulator